MTARVGMTHIEPAAQNDAMCKTDCDGAATASNTVQLAFTNFQATGAMPATETQPQAIPGNGCYASHCRYSCSFYKPLHKTLQYVPMRADLKWQPGNG
jgi:hypothetical protein